MVRCTAYFLEGACNPGFSVLLHCYFSEVNVLGRR